VCCDPASSWLASLPWQQLAQPDEDNISNGNDIETKRSDTSILGVFFVSKRNEPTYSRSCKDGSEVNTIIIILCRIEEITNIISPEFARWKRKRT
jgi:hypothetical protein